jgi:hypothetical protein
MKNKVVLLFNALSHSSLLVFLTSQSYSVFHEALLLILSLSEMSLVFSRSGEIVGFINVDTEKPAHDEEQFVIELQIVKIHLAVC